MWGPACSHQTGKTPSLGPVWRPTRAAETRVRDVPPRVPGCCPGGLTGSSPGLSPCQTGTPSGITNIIMSFIHVFKMFIGCIQNILRKCLNFAPCVIQTLALAYFLWLFAFKWPFRTLTVRTVHCSVWCRLKKFTFYFLLLIVRKLTKCLRLMCFKCISNEKILQLNTG